MIKISSNITELDFNRRKEIIAKSYIINELIENDRPRHSYELGLNWKCSKAKSIYWLKYNEQLSSEELTLLYLYVVIPNDNDFLNMLKKYNNDFKKVSQIYGVSSTFIKLRYINLINMKIEEAKNKENKEENLLKTNLNNTYRNLKLTLEF